MLILAFKLFLTPLLIVSVTLAGRRWGTAVSGLLIGLPLVSAPISVLSRDMSDVVLALSWWLYFLVIADKPHVG